MNCIPPLLFFLVQLNGTFFLVLLPVIFSRYYLCIILYSIYFTFFLSLIIFIEEYRSVQCLFLFQWSSEEYMKERNQGRVQGLGYVRNACRHNRNNWRLFCRGHPLGELQEWGVRAIEVIQQAFEGTSMIADCWNAYYICWRMSWIWVYTTWICWIVWS